MTDAAFERWRMVLLVQTVFFGFLGIVWAATGTFDPTGTWDGWMAQGVIGHPERSAETVAVENLLVGIVGALNTAYFVLFTALVMVPIKRRELWAWNTIVVSAVIWACIDMSASVAAGAAFNAYLVDAGYLVVIGIPLFALRPGLRPPASP